MEGTGACVIDVRLRSRISPKELEQKVGKLVTHRDYNLLLTGRCRVAKPDGSPLCVYLPGVLTDELSPDVYDVLYRLRSLKTDNRGLASGTQRRRKGEEKRTRSGLVSSVILGAYDPGGPKQFCRLTAWTGVHLPEWQSLRPLLRRISSQFAVHVPDRFAAQKARAEDTKPEWMVGDTVFSTVTVNNTYPNGVHTDSGDLATGFSCLAVARKGHYAGCELVFPEYRVAVDMRHGDLLLMDAHEWHGNTAFRDQDTDASRISVVCYYRENMARCGTFEDERMKADAYAEKRSGLLDA